MSGPPVTVHEDVPANGESVILLHGLGRTAHAMRPMARHLVRCGYGVIRVGYPSTRWPVRPLARAAVGAGLIHQTACHRPVHFVRHSLGGILARAYLADHDIPALGRIVMLAPPSHGSEIIDALGYRRVFRWLLGPAAQELGTGIDSLPNQLGAAAFECGIIAGDRCRDPLGARYVPRPCDGKVAVASTHLAGMSDHLRLPVGHTTIMADRPVQAQTAYFLTHGRFNRLP